MDWISLFIVYLRYLLYTQCTRQAGVLSEEFCRRGVVTECFVLSRRGGGVSLSWGLSASVRLVIMMKLKIIRESATQEQTPARQMIMNSVNIEDFRDFVNSTVAEVIGNAGHLPAQNHGSAGGKK